MDRSITVSLVRSGYDARLLSSYWLSGATWDVCIGIALLLNVSCAMVDFGWTYSPSLSNKAGEWMLLTRNFELGEDGGISKSAWEIEADPAITFQWETR